MHQPLHQLSVVQQSISEDEESDDYGYEYSAEYDADILKSNETGNSDDSTSSNSSSTRLSPSLLRPLILRPTNSLETGSDHGTGHKRSYSYKSYTAALQHNEDDVVISDTESASEIRLAVGSGAATIAAIPSSSSSKRHAAASRYCNTLVFTARRRKNPCMFAIITGFTLLGIFLYTKSYATLHNALQQVTLLKQQRNEVREHFLNVEEDIQRLHKELLDLDLVAVILSGGEDEGSSNNGDGDNTSQNKQQQRENVVDEMVALQEKLREGNSQIGSLQKHLQEMSKRDAAKKYGTAVIRVKLELEFPGEENLKAGLGRPTVLVFEMAPLDLVPHSVYMFLEMVHAGLFDGCSFILNAMHVIKAAPLPYDGSSASQKVKAFTKLGLETVAFREYSSEFPHEQYTVGFAADGSPSFYINTQDNTELHVGEPCFAKVVSGFDTVARLEAAPTRNGIFYRRRIGIKRAFIL
jgi:cyclophilin family peptidyl-prolyl cis-trans isomerase